MDAERSIKAAELQPEDQYQFRDQSITIGTDSGQVSSTLVLISLLSPCPYSGVSGVSGLIWLIKYFTIVQFYDQFFNLSFSTKYMIIFLNKVSL